MGKPQAAPEILKLDRKVYKVQQVRQVKLALWEFMDWKEWKEKWVSHDIQGRRFLKGLWVEPLLRVPNDKPAQQVLKEQREIPVLQNSQVIYRRNWSIWSNRCTRFERSNLTKLIQPL